MTVAPTMREKDLREQVRSLCKLFGWQMAFTQYSIMSPKGFPDLCLVRGPRLIFAELKTMIGKTSPEQDDWLAALQGVPGVEVYLWRPNDLEAIARILGGEKAAVR